jgi:microcystin-dependent protein
MNGLLTRRSDIGCIARTSLIALYVCATPALLIGQTETGVTGDGTPVENRQPSLGLRYIIAMQGYFPQDPASGVTPPGGTQAPDRNEPFMGEIRAVPYNVAPRGWAFCEGQLLSINQNQALFSLLLTRYGGNGQTTFALPDLRGRVPIGAGQGPDLPNYTLGQKVGSAQVALTPANLPAHSHSVPNGQTGTTGSDVPIDNLQPALALHFLIAANGEIIIAPWEPQPGGWVRCSGQLLAVAQYNHLFGHIGYSYGGSGPVFALPDLRGRVVVGYNSTSEPLIGAARGTTTSWWRAICQMVAWTPRLARTA